MQNAERYHPKNFKLSADELAWFSALEPSRSARALLFVWVWILALLIVSSELLQSSYFWYLYPVLGFLIASRQGALLQLVHEAAHGLLDTDPGRNKFIGKFLCALPVGVFFEGYVSGHRGHHAFTGTPQDPPSDTEKYEFVDRRRIGFYALFLKDLLGLTALKVFLAYGGKKSSLETMQEPGALGAQFRKLAELIFVQAVLFAVLFRADIVQYVLFWLLPAMCFHMFLMRVRGLAEHGLARQLGRIVDRQDQGIFFTRSFLTPVQSYAFSPLAYLEKFLIGSLNVHYHHEHHLFPGVPFYHLPLLHRRLAPQIAAENTLIYAKGYFAAAFTQPLFEPGQQTAPLTAANKSALITGTTSGIGKALKEKLLEEGWNVIEVNRSDLDITSATEVFRYLQRFHQSKTEPSVLYLNAGINRPDNVTCFDFSTFQAVVEVNLRGVLTFVEALQKLGWKNKTILCLSSTSNIVPNPGHIGYYLSKLALKESFRLLAKRDGANRYKAVVLGPVTTRISRDFAAPKGAMALLLKWLAVPANNAATALIAFARSPQSVLNYPLRAVLFYRVVKAVLCVFPGLYQGTVDSPLGQPNAAPEKSLAKLRPADASAPL